MHPNRLPQFRVSELSAQQRELLASLTANVMDAGGGVPWTLTAEQLERYSASGRRPPGAPEVKADGTIVAQGPVATYFLGPEIGHALGNLSKRILGGPLRPDLREVAILCVAAHWRSPYEWDRHDAVARAVGISDDAVDAIRERRQPVLEDKAQTAVYESTMEFLATGRISEEAFARLKAQLSFEDIFEMFCAIGAYNFYAVLLNGFAIGAPTGNVCFPESPL